MKLMKVVDLSISTKICYLIKNYTYFQKITSKKKENLKKWRIFYLLIDKASGREGGEQDEYN